MSKEEILKKIDEKLSEKIAHLTRLIDETRASNNETKSSMGDKYETTREMVQQEINNLQVQLNENVRAKNSLKFINVNVHHTVSLGSLVTTDKGLYYIAVSLGTMELDRQKIFLISPESPLAQAMLGKSEGESSLINGIKQVLIKIH